MDREQQPLNGLLAADPEPGELGCVTRRGDDRRGAGGGNGADAWIVHAWHRPLGRSDTERATSGAR